MNFSWATVFLRLFQSLTVRGKKGTLKTVIIGAKGRYC